MLSTAGIRARAFTFVAFAALVNLTVLAARVHGENRSGNAVIENRYLSVRFAGSRYGPKLKQIEDKISGRTYSFEDSQQFGLVAVRPKEVHDSSLEIAWEFPQDMEFQTAKVSADKAELSVSFDHTLAKVNVFYRLREDSPILRKNIVCRAKEGGAYVAGITHWRLKPADHAAIWPAKDTVAQPVVAANAGSGFFATLQWPRAAAKTSDGHITLSYRPGFLLEPGQSKQVSAGSIGLFQRKYPGQSDLDAAREAFFEHMRQVVKPNVPFPIKFTTWGPWRGQATAERIMRVLDDLKYVGTELLHFDAGWENQDRPTGIRTYFARTLSDEIWDSCMTERMRVPNGLLPIVEAAKKRGMELSLWFDACGNVFNKESEKWAVVDEEGKPVYSMMWSDRSEQAPRQSLATEYGDMVKEKVLQAMDRYDLGGVMFDNQSYTTDFGKDRKSLANGWNSVDVQLGKILEIFDEVERRRPGIYRFFCRGSAWPWALAHATHIHAGDPFVSPQGDYPARAVALSRLRAWRSHYNNFVPPWGIKGDIAGWSGQQNSPIPVNLKDTGRLIPAGEGWTQNMFMCFATTAVRDIRFSFEQMPQFDKDILKEWLAWDRKRTGFIFNCRPVTLGHNRKPNEGLDVISHVRSGKGVVYIFNRSFELVTTDIKLDKKAGFEPSERVLAYMVYPVKASLGRLSFGQSLKVPVIGKDCVVIEVGLDRPREVRNLSEYEQIAETVHRSFQPVYRVPAERLFDICRNNSIHLQVGDSPRDRRVAGEIVDALGAATGDRIDLARWENAPVSQADYRLIIGTSQGLAGHPDIGDRFVQTLYNKYIDWNGRLYSAPLAVEFESSGIPTICLIAPRPEQLAQLNIDLTDRLLKGYEETAELTPPKSVSFTVPANDPLLRFEPTVSYVVHAPLPDTLAPVRFEIEVETSGKTVTIWNEEIPPFCCARDRKWWKDRVVSLKQFAGRKIRLNFTAKHVRGPGHPNFLFGYKRISVLQRPNSRTQSRDMGDGFVNHGVPVRVSRTCGGAVVQDGQGRPRLLLGIQEHRGASGLAMIDPDTGQTKFYDLPFETNRAPFAFLYSKRGYYYMLFGSRFIEFDPRTGKYTFVTEAPDRAMWLTEDDNGVIWAGTFPKAHIVSFDPRTREYTDHGPINEENWNQYPRRIATDSGGWVYAAIGFTRNHIIALDPRTGNVKPMVKEEDRVGGGVAGNLWRGEDGNVYGRMPDGGPWLRMHAGQATTLKGEPHTAPVRELSSRQGRVFGKLPDGRVIDRVKMSERWIRVVGQDSRPVQVSFDYPSRGARIHSLARGPDGRLCGATGHPGHFFAFDAQTDSIWQEPSGGGHINAMTVQAGKLYGAKYTQGVLVEYEMNRLETGDKPDQRVLAEAGGVLLRPFAILALSDCRHVIQTGAPAYGRTGGGMMVYDVQTEQARVYEHTQLIKYHSTKALAELPDGNLIGGTTIQPGTGGEAVAKECELYIMEWPSLDIVYRETILPGSREIRELIVAEDGLVYGLAWQDIFFVFDPASRKLVHCESIAQRYGGMAGGQAPRVWSTGPDGNIYALFKKAVVRIEPGTFKHEKIADTPVEVDIGAVLLGGRLYFASGPSLWSYEIPEIASGQGAMESHAERLVAMANVMQANH